MDRGEALIIGLSIGLAIAIPAVAYMLLRRRAERRFAAQQLASTVTFLGVRDQDLQASFARAQGGRLNIEAIPWGFIVNVSGSGIDVFRSGLRPRALLSIPRSRVISIDLGTNTAKPESRSAVLPRIRCRVRPLNSAGAQIEPDSEPVDIELGVQRLAASPFFGGGFADDATVQALAVKANNALLGRALADGSSAVISTVARPGTLIPGTTAHHASRVAGVPVHRATTWLSVPFLAPFAAWLVTQSTVWFVISLVTLLASVLLTVMLFLRANRGEARESEAGYTTLNGRHLELEQRHPVSGMIVREAGGMALTDDQFRRLVES